MKRNALKFLNKWVINEQPKPLIIRGARQVGKSTLVRSFAQEKGLTLAEINLERHPTLDRVFATNNTQNILSELEGLCQKNLHEQNTILFLDEIQATPSALPALRYLHEDFPTLPIIAAGSLLEFLLAKHSFSMPVGRIEYFHLGPMSFEEFLMALGDNFELQQLKEFQWTKPIPETLHAKLLQRQREFLFVGGMPEAVLTFVETQSLEQTRAVHRRMIQTYQDDFSKYARQTHWLRLHKIFEIFPRIAGKKVKYTEISREDRSADIKASIDLLIKARVLLPAYHSDTNGVPLAAEKRDSVYKLYFLDVGLLSYLSGIDWTTIANTDERVLINEGSLAEQFIAQHLAYRDQGLEPPELFYWLRESKAQNAEVDFVLSKSQEIIPVEVKAGHGNTLKSLHQFMAQRKSVRGLRFNLDKPLEQKIACAVPTQGNKRHKKFSLISLPLYLVEEWRRMVS